MRTWIVVAALAALAGCRGEPVPRDYQNHPPGVAQPAQTGSQAPAAHGGGDAPPQPTTGVEGTAGPYEPMSPTQPAGGTLPDTPPTST
ncbi:MAG TPA: hypothetical protein VGF28_08010 [Thermoanaerobaculia bacterium]|jgi:hypothetical protein